MAQNGWDKVYQQTKTTSQSWEPLWSGSKVGYTLGAKGTTSYYHLTESLNFTNSWDDSGLNLNGSGLTIKGTVYLYIPAGLTLTCVGADAKGTTGASAGIELAAGDTLYIIGGGQKSSDESYGKVIAKGGKAANGSNGGNGGFGGAASLVSPYF